MFNRFSIKIFRIEFSTLKTILKRQDQFWKHLTESVSRHFEGDCAYTLRVLQPIWAIMKNHLNCSLKKWNKLLTSILNYCMHFHGHIISILLGVGVGFFRDSIKSIRQPGVRSFAIHCATAQWARSFDFRLALLFRLFFIGHMHIAEQMN